jgi:hypothetical protein
MPKNTHYIVALILIVLFVNVGSVYFGQKHARENQETALMQLTSTSTTQPLTQPTTTPATKNQNGASTQSGSTKIPGFYSYANATYHFSMQYPSYVRPLTSFSTFHELSNNWRVYASPANQGKSAVSFSIYTVDQGIYYTGKQTYPLYFTAEVRVGVSPNIKECYTPDASFPGQKVTNVTINGVMFKKFSSTESNDPKYTQVESYRTIRNNNCYVIEQIQSGTRLKDPKMAINKTDEQLTSYYNLGEKIVKSFTFTK